MQELAAQAGQNGDSSIAILPTLRINHIQYRGTLDASSE